MAKETSRELQSLSTDTLEVYLRLLEKPYYRTRDTEKQVGIITGILSNRRSANESLVDTKQSDNEEVSDSEQ